MVRSEIGNRIKELREVHNFTREELAEKAEISSKFLYEVEKGRKGLSADTLMKISKTLSCSCDYILTGTNATDETTDKLHVLLERFDSKQKEQALNVLELINQMCSKK